MKRILVTSALPYANGYLHLGHCAGAYLPADIFVRFLRLKGENVLWICGSDEHGVAITIAAEKEGVSPNTIIDKYHEQNKTAFHKFGMTFDIYSRTSNKIHHETAREFFSDFLSKNLLAEKEEEQFFDQKAKIFLPDRYVEGICPNCGSVNARGDQCDACGAYYNQLELKNPRSLVTGDMPIVKKTIHWYLKFDLFQDFLEKYIDSHKSEWKENVYQQTKSWLNQGLAERAITRDLSWGVQIDGIEGITTEKSAGKVLYVWFEAVLGYISATKEWAALNNQPDEWKNWWQNSDTRYIAFIGKDNIVFHTLIFPALLHARDENYILPDNVPANEFLNLEGQKFSKSRNWSIDLRDFQADFPKPGYNDVLRYTLAMNFPETKDSDFTWKDFQSRNNNELAAIYGNFVNRTMQFIQKNFDGKIPVLPEEYKDLPETWHKYLIGNDEVNFPSDNENLLFCSLRTTFKKITSNYEKFRFRDAITETMNIARSANKYFNDEEPWKTVKSNPEKCAKTLYICSQLVNSLAMLFAPVLSDTSKKVFNILNRNAYTGEVLPGRKYENNWDSALKFRIPEGAVLRTPEILFTKIEDEVIDKQISKLGTMNTEPPKEPMQELISYDDFTKIKLRTAKVLEAGNVPKSKKLIKLLIDTGAEKRQIIAGVAEHYKPEDLVGKTIVVVANLQPAKLMGIESNGMLLAANTTDGNLSVIFIDDIKIGPGAEVR